MNSSAIAAMTTREIKPKNAPLALRKIAMATMGKNSPTAPAAMMNAPNRPSSIWLSRRIGSSVPSAVVVRPIAIGTNAWTKPTAAKRAGNGDRDYRCHQPGLQREPSGPLAEQLELELVARQQEEEPEADVGYQLDAVRVGPPQDLRPGIR